MRMLFHLPIVILTLVLWIGWTSEISAQSVELECGQESTTRLLEYELALPLDIETGVTTLVSDVTGLIPPTESSVMMPQVGDCTMVDGLIQEGLEPVEEFADADIYLLLLEAPITRFRLMLHRHPATAFGLVVEDGTTGAFISDCLDSVTRVLLDVCPIQPRSTSVRISISADHRSTYTLGIINSPASLVR